MVKKIYNKKYLTPYRKSLRKQPTKSEDILWLNLKNSQLGWKFRRQHSIGKYIVDFYCVPLKLVIELDGISHQEEDVYNKDIDKELDLTAYGCEVLRFEDIQVYEDLENVLEVIYITCKLLAHP